MTPNININNSIPVSCFYRKENRLSFLFQEQRDLDQSIVELFFAAAPLYTKHADHFSLVCKDWNCLFTNIRCIGPKSLINKTLNNLSKISFECFPLHLQRPFSICSQTLSKNFNSLSCKNEVSWRDIGSTLNLGIQGKRLPEGGVDANDLFKFKAMPYILLHSNHNEIPDEELNPKAFLFNLIQHEGYELASSYLSLLGRKNNLMRDLINKFGHSEALKLILSNKGSFQDNCSSFIYYNCTDLVQLLSQEFIQSLSLLSDLPDRPLNFVLNHMARLISEGARDDLSNICCDRWLIAYQGCVSALFPHAGEFDKIEIMEGSLKRDWFQCFSGLSTNPNLTIAPNTALHAMCVRLDLTNSFELFLTQM